MNSEKIHKLVGIGLLTALVAVVYFLTMGITVGPFNITFALIPIVVGAALYGWAAGWDWFSVRWYCLPAALMRSL